MNKLFLYIHKIEGRKPIRAFLLGAFLLAGYISFSQVPQTKEPKTILEKGKVYGYVYPRVRGEYLLKSQPKGGRATYEDLSFSQLTLSYDMYNDLVFTASIGKMGNRYLILNAHKLSEFWVNDRHFLHLTESPTPLLLPPGYYQLIYQQENMTVLKKWQVKMNRYASSIASADGGQKPFKFVSDHKHFLVRNEEVVVVDKKKELLAALGNVSGLKAFMKANRIKLKDNQSEVYSEELVRVLDYSLNR